MSFGTIFEVNIDTGTFDNCKKLEYIYFNKSMTSLSGSCLQFVQRYHCDGKKCGCKDGYGNIHDITSSLYRCEAVQRRQN